MWISLEVMVRWKIGTLGKAIDDVDYLCIFIYNVL